MAQQSNSLFFMDRIPQSNQLNPAIQPLCNFYIGIPGTNMELSAGNSALGFGDVLTYNSEIDSMVWPTYDSKTKNDFLNKLKETNYVYSESRVDLLSFGFRVQNTYLSFNLTERVESYGFLPKDLFKFGLYMNDPTFGSQSFDISNLGFKAQWFREFGVGISQQINPKVNFGIRAKFLLGIANVTTANSTMKINNTGVYQWEAQSAIEANSSIPGLIVYETNGKVDSTDFADINDFSDAKDLFWKSKNTGFALDIGILAQPVKNLSISASVVDLGFIRWKSNNHNFTTGGSTDFRGLNINLNDKNPGETLLDSLGKEYKPSTNTDPYTTSISAKLYAGVHYQLLKSVGIGALSRFQLVKNTVKPQFTFSLNLTSKQWLGYTISYTIADGMYDNLGIGYVAKLGPFQYYFITERIPLAWQKNSGSGIPFVPKYYRSVNFRTGFNLVFGCKRKIKIDKDKPFVDI
jgi:hypothetical protein